MERNPNKEQSHINFSKDKAIRELASLNLPVFRSLLEDSRKFIDKTMEFSSNVEDETDPTKTYAFFKRRMREVLPEMAKSFNETVCLLESEAKELGLRLPKVRRVREEIKLTGNYFDILLGIKNGSIILWIF